MAHSHTVQYNIFTHAWSIIQLCHTQYFKDAKNVTVLLWQYPVYFKWNLKELQVGHSLIDRGRRFHRLPPRTDMTDWPKVVSLCGIATSPLAEARVVLGGLLHLTNSISEGGARLFSIFNIRQSAFSFVMFSLYLTKCGNDEKKLFFLSSTFSAFL